MYVRSGQMSEISSSNDSLTNAASAISTAMIAAAAYVGLTGRRTGARRIDRHIAT